jgi:hypothetical protein
MKFVTKITACLIAALCVIAVSSCSKDEPDFVDETIKYIPTENVEENIAEEVPEPDPVPEPEPAKPEFVNPLSGEATTEELVNNRPVAIMLNNIHVAMPQMAISYADIIYEVLEEGGITRLMALYHDYENLPEIGSIRSARDYYIDLSDAHDAIYVHCGGSTYAKDVLAKRKTENIDGMFLGNFYRSKERRKTMASEHTLMITGEGLAKNIAQKGYRTESTASQPLSFHDFETDFEGNTANNIKVPFSLALEPNPYALSTFEYNPEKGKYLKSHYNEAHIDGTTGEQLAFENVVILECKQYQIPGDKLLCIASEFVGTGNGKYASNGVIKDITWKKNSRTSIYSLYESDGVTPLLLNPGKSYIAIVPTGTVITAN